MSFNQLRKRQRERARQHDRQSKRLCGLAPLATNPFLTLPRELLAKVLDFGGGLLAEATCKAWHAAREGRSALLFWALSHNISGARVLTSVQLLQTVVCGLRRRKRVAGLHSLSVHGPRLGECCEAWRGAFIYGLLHQDGMAAMMTSHKTWLDQNVGAPLPQGAGLQLLHLDLSGFNLSKNGTTSCWILHAICEQRRLQRLALNDCGLGDVVVCMLSRMAELRELELGANRRLRLVPTETSEGGSVSVSQPQQRDHPLSQLRHLRRLRLGALVASVAPSRLPSGSRRQPAGSGVASSCGYERRMRLHHAAFDFGGASPNGTLPLTLTELDLAWSGRALGRASFAALSPLTVLRSLRLNGCRQFDDACACGALRDMRRITMLNLSGTSVGCGYLRQRSDEQLPRPRGTDGAGADSGDTMSAWLCARRLPELRTLLIADVRFINGQGNGQSTDSASAMALDRADGLLQVDWEGFTTLRALSLYNSGTSRGRAVPLAQRLAQLTKRPNGGLTALDLGKTGGNVSPEGLCELLDPPAPRVSRMRLLGVGGGPRAVVDAVARERAARNLPFLNLFASEPALQYDCSPGTDGNRNGKLWATRRRWGGRGLVPTL